MRFKTELILAVERGYIEIVKLFLEHEGIDINVKYLNINNLVFILTIWSLFLLFKNVLI